MLKKLLYPKSTAVIAIDLQNAYCSPKGEMAKLGFGVSHFGKIAQKIDAFLRHARKKGATVIFTKMIEDPNLMAKNVRIKMIAEKSHRICTPGTSGFEYFHIRPQKGGKNPDMEIVKKSYDAFSNKSLEKILRRKKIKSLILVGGYTQVCVDSTLRSAFTGGYHIIVPKDLISGPSQRRPQEKVIMGIWSRFFAYVVHSRDILKIWGVKA